MKELSANSSSSEFGCASMVDLYLGISILKTTVTSYCCTFYREPKLQSLHEVVILSFIRMPLHDSLLLLIVMLQGKR